MVQFYVLKIFKTR